MQIPSRSPISSLCAALGIFEIITHLMQFDRMWIDAHIANQPKATVLMTLINPCNSVLIGINQNRVSCNAFHYKLLCNNSFFCWHFFSRRSRKNLSF